MAAETVRAISVVTGPALSHADIRDARAAVVKITEDLTKVNDEYLAENREIARKLAGELAKGNVDLVQRYRELKPRLDQRAERLASLTFFRQVAFEGWAYLKREHRLLVKQVLIEERNRLESERDKRDQETEARIIAIDNELAELEKSSEAAHAYGSGPEQTFTAVDVVDEVTRSPVVGGARAVRSGRPRRTRSRR